MKPCLYSVSLPDRDPVAAIELARSAGYAGIEWRVSPDAFDPARAPDFFANNRCTVPPDAAELARIAQMCRAAGLDVVGLSPYLATGDMAGAEAMMALAAGIGAPWIRMRAPWRNEGPATELFDRAAAFFEQVAGLAGRYGVRALIELHQRTICASASAALRLVSRYDPGQVGVIYDAGNLILEGFEDHAFAVEILGPYLQHVHLKNALYGPAPDGGPWVPSWSALDEGILDLPKLLGALAAGGYAGWISVEDFSTARPYAETVRFDAELLSRELAKVNSGACPVAAGREAS
jgi:sugar phosphate isomerase/epimerase